MPTLYLIMMTPNTRAGRAEAGWVSVVLAEHHSLLLGQVGVIGLTEGAGNVGRPWTHSPLSLGL
ncbi:MAG TPA: hypothetical protein VI036_16285, partial [Propionibacteriaceae bacterium]